VLDTKPCFCSTSHPLFQQYSTGTDNACHKYHRPSNLQRIPIRSNSLLSASAARPLRQLVRSFVSLEKSITSDIRLLDVRCSVCSSAHQFSGPSGVASAKRDPDEIVMSHPTKGELVYIGTLARMVRIVKIFSLSTSVMGVSIQPIIYDQV